MHKCVYVSMYTLTSQFLRGATRRIKGHSLARFCKSPACCLGQARQVCLACFSLTHTLSLSLSLTRAHRPSIKGTKLLLTVIKAIIIITLPSLLPLPPPAHTHDQSLSRPNLFLSTDPLLALSRPNIFPLLALILHW